MPLRITLLSLTTLLLSLTLFTLTPSQASACGILTSSVPRGYGVPQNFFSGSRELTVNAQCEDDTFQPIVGSSRTDSSNFAVYTTGYRWSGTKWESYTLTTRGSDATKTGQWILGDAQGPNTLTYASSNDPTYFVAYSCHWVNNAWKCGCQTSSCSQPAWQLQAVRKPYVAPPPTTGGGGGGGAPVNLEPGECIVPPTLTDPQICNVSPSGGNCSFGTRDGIVRMPNVPVTGSVSIDGGRNVHLIGGEIRQEPGHITGVAINNGPRNLHIEGLMIDAQRNCDAIAVRGRDRKKGPNAGINTRLTIQNVRTQGMDYNNPRAGRNDCHGDCLQFQFPSELTGLEFDISINNMTCHTASQGFFTPLRSNQPGTQNIRANYNNLNFTRDNSFQNYIGAKGLGLLWMQNKGGPRINRSYPAQLNNVFAVDNRNFLTDETVGTVNIGVPPNGDFAPQSAVGLNYERANFCTN